MSAEKPFDFNIAKANLLEHLEDHKRLAPKKGRAYKRLKFAIALMKETPADACVIFSYRDLAMFSAKCGAWYDCESEFIKQWACDAPSVCFICALTKALDDYLVAKGVYAHVC